MLKNYFTIALRNFRKFKTYSLINIFGLAIGLACCILILLHIHDELNFDRFHQKADRIFRVIQIRSGSQGEQHSAYTMGPFGPALVDEFPEVEASVQFFQGSRLTVKREATPLSRGQIVRRNFFTDASFFILFDFQLIAGDRSSALSAPGSVVLTETMAKKLFGDEEPLGKALQIEAEDFPEFGKTAFKVTGVLRDAPHNSHLDFNLLISRSTLDRFAEIQGWLNSWDETIVITYVLLNTPVVKTDLEAKLVEFNRKHRGEEAAARSRFYLQPLGDVHFGSAEIGSEQNTHEGQIVYVYVFAAMAIFIAAIACINYMNLATARSMKRAKEVGLRKVVGAGRGQMIGQFLMESILSAVIAFLLAIGLVEAALPFFNSLASANLSLSIVQNSSVFFGLLALVLLVGLVAGSYPAFYLSGLKPAAVLKGELKAGTQRSRLRQSLVITQFALSILMIVATLVVFRQLDYARHKKLGFNQEQLVVIDINHDDVQANFLTVKNEFLREAAVRSVTVSSRVPGDWKGFRRIGVVKDGQSEAETQTMFFNGVDESFIDTYEIELAQGRNFSRALTSDSAAVILNETAAKTLFRDSPLDQVIRVPSYNFTGHVIGVVRDFHFHSLHDKIAPVVMGFMPAGGRHVIHGIDYFSLRIANENVQETVDFMTRVHARFDPVNPIELGFLDQWWIDLYNRDERLGRIFGISASLAILIACVGLFGLAAFMAEQRTKEIGVRKVLGASIASIVMLLSKDFTRLVLLGLLAATPLAYFAMNKWLQNFAYRMDVGWWVFALAGGMALMIALATVSTQAIKAALANPVDSLRYE
jgi:putative ABC transport system permease protein